MRQSAALVPTLREAPAEAEAPGHRLLLRGGFARGLAAGLAQLLPMGVRVQRRLRARCVEALEALGAEECALAWAQPADLWGRAGARETLGREVLRAPDQLGRELLLGPAPDPALLALVAGVVGSHRDLPRRLWQTRRAWRDRARSRPGLLELRERELLEVWVLAGDAAGLAEARARTREALERALLGCGLDLATGPASGLTRGGAGEAGWVLTAEGRDAYLECPGCGTRGDPAVLPRAAAPPPADPGPAPEQVATPGCTSIEEVATFLGVPTSATAKAVFFARQDGRLVFAVVRGDQEVSEAKLALAAGARGLRPARDEEIRAAGAVPGYASPVGLAGGVLVLVDGLVASSPGLVAGANREGHHLTGVAFGRDYQGQVADLGPVRAGECCHRCGGPLEAPGAVRVLRDLALGDGLAGALGATSQDAAGKVAPVHAAVLEVDLAAALGALAARRAAADPPAPWPPAASPFDVHVLALAGKKDEAVLPAAARLAEALRTAGLRVLLDDRPARAGEKFADADLLGIPLRLVLGRRGVEAREAEVRDLRTGEAWPTAFHLVRDRVVGLASRG